MTPVMLFSHCPTEHSQNSNQSRSFSFSAEQRWWDSRFVLQLLQGLLRSSGSNAGRPPSCVFPIVTRWFQGPEGMTQGTHVQLQTATWFLASCIVLNIRTV